MPVVLPGGTSRLLTPTWAFLQAGLPSAQHDRLFTEPALPALYQTPVLGYPVLESHNCPVFGGNDACALDLRSMISAPLEYANGPYLAPFGIGDQRALQIALC